MQFQNNENINFVEKLYFFILYNQVYIAKHVLKFLHSGFIISENTNHNKVGGKWIISYVISSSLIKLRTLHLHWYN